MLGGCVRVQKGMLGGYVSSSKEVEDWESVRGNLWVRNLPREFK